MSVAPTAAWTSLEPGRWPDPGAMTSLRLEGHYLVVGRTEDGTPFAVDGRCPHEGYPLVQGEVKDRTLTCRWHNWKFDLRDGSCRLGGEGVRAYPVREVDGRLEIDLSEPDPESLRPALRRSLEEALFDRDVARAVRDGVRLIQTGLDPWHLLVDVACYDATHAAYGSTHVLALATDCGRLLSDGMGPGALHAVAPVLELCAESNVRLPEHALPEPMSGASEQALREAVEGEQLARALGLLRGAFAEGRQRAAIESWLLAAAADHFTSFGHQLIYLMKAAELLDHDERGGDHAEAIYVGWLRGLVLATREDTLPYWRPYAERLAALEPELDELAAAARPGTAHDGAALRDAVLDGSAAEALDALVGRLRAGVPASDLSRWLVGAAAHRLLRFDVGLDADPSVVEGWLWATHRFTYASAVRRATRDRNDGAALRLLMHTLAFTHSGAALDVAPADRLGPAGRPEDALEVEAVGQAIAHRQTDRAVRAAAGWLASDRDLAPLRALVSELGRGDGLVRPIVVAHAIKTTAAAWEEYDALVDHPDRHVGVLAAVRLLASPVVERRVRAVVDEAIDWVVEGRMPKKLTQ